MEDQQQGALISETQHQQQDTLISETQQQQQQGNLVNSETQQQQQDTLWAEIQQQQQDTLISETQQQQQDMLISETQQQKQQGTVNSETQQQQQGTVNLETHVETDWSSTNNMQEKKRLDIPVEKKNLVAQYLLLNSSGLVIIEGALIDAVNKFNISRRSVQEIWKITKCQAARGQLISMLGRGNKGNRHYDKLELDVEKVRSLPMNKRTSIMKLAARLGINKSTLGRMIQQKDLRPHTSAIKPLLTEANKLARLKFSLSQLVCSNSGPNMKFQTMHNVVHIDEKWFFMTKTEHRYYLLPTEEEPYRCCKSKRFISKVTFMCAVARPQFSLDGQCLFDGKIGIFPFTTLEPTMRNSKNRVKWTLETKPLHSVIKQVIKDCIINEVIPAIKPKWSTNGTKEILIQQDNAKPHIKHDDIDFMAVVNSEGFNIKLICQPANSPDTNMNDLGFFNDLLQNVKSSFEELSAQTLNNVFFTLQMCLIEIMKVKGGNNYKIPHMNKQRLIALEKLPESIEVERSIVKDCLRFLSQLENDAGSSYDIEALIRATKD